MPYQLSWIIPKRVILMEFRGAMDEADVRECDRAIVKMIDEGDADAALIHQILIMHDRSSHARLSLLSTLAWPKHPRNGWLVAVAIANPMIRIVGNLAAQITKMRAKSVDTIEQGVEFLYYVDVTLPKNKSIAALIADHMVAKSG